MTTLCKYGDPLCPCQDGDACHYEGENPMRVPAPYLIDASGERPKDDLVERRPKLVDDAYVMEWVAEAAAEIERLREQEAEIARLNRAAELYTEAASAATLQWEQRAERAEAERDTQNRALAQCRALLKQECEDVAPLRDERDRMLAVIDAAKAIDYEMFNGMTPSVGAANKLKHALAQLEKPCDCVRPEIHGHQLLCKQGKAR